MRSVSRIAVRVSITLGLTAGLGLVVTDHGATPRAWADEPQPGGNQEISLAYSGFDPEQFLASADPDQIGLMDGARTQTMGTFAVGMLFHFAGPPLDICVKDGNDPSGQCKVLGDVLNARLRADLGVLYGLGRFDVRLTLPLVLHQSTDFQPSMGQTGLSSAGVGNPRVSGRVQIARPADFDFAFDLGVQIPTGQANFIGDEGIIVDPRLLLDWRRGPIGVGLDFGYRYRKQSAKVANLYVDDELLWSAAAQYQILPRKLSVAVAAYGRAGLMTPELDLSEQMHVVSKLGPEEFPAEILGSARYFLTPQIAVDLGAGTALTPGYGAAPYRVLAGVRLMQQKAAARGDGRRTSSADRDKDGVGDDDDQCPKEAEDEDGFQDTDGCPELDNDEDGKADNRDKCPLAAEDKDDYEDSDGCPDYDNDTDGVSDDEDKCPNLAEDMDGFEDEDGCPDLDGDGDGVSDADDKCPEEAGDAANEGCAIQDADGDNINGAADQCPDDPESVNGIQDEDGCPDATFEVAFDKARIRSTSYAALKAVAGSLKGRGSVRVRIEGHTKDATAGINQQRAEAVVAFLVKEGVDGKRLEARGYQPSAEASGMVFVILGETKATAPVTRVEPPVVTPPVAAADKDSDGIADKSDRCPKAAEDMDGFQDEDGCPDPDNDGDGIADRDDRCPDEKGAIATKGCAGAGAVTPPVVTPPVVTPPVVTPPVVTPPVVTPPVADAGDADAETVTLDVVFDKARVRHASYAALDKLGASLKSSGAKVRIEGHTADADQKLNQDRADSVAKYLVKKGVKAGQLEAVGFAAGGDATGIVFVISK